MKIVCFVLCFWSGVSRALVVDLALFDHTRVRAADVIARARWFEERGVDYVSVAVPNRPGAPAEIGEELARRLPGSGSVDALILNVHEADRRQRFSLGALGVLTLDGPDEALALALRGLEGRMAADARVIVVSPSLRRAKSRELRPRVERLMRHLGATVGTAYLLGRTPGPTAPRRPNASLYAAIATFAGLVPLTLLSIVPPTALPTFALMAGAVVGVDRWVVTDGLRATVRKIWADARFAPARRWRLRGGEVAFEDRVHLNDGFASLRACAQALGD